MRCARGAQAQADPRHFGIVRERMRTTEDDDRLAHAFDALSSPIRFALLRELRAPRTLSSIRVAPMEGSDSALLARQSVRRHIDQLVESGLLLARPVRGVRGETVEYGANRQRLFVLAEELLSLAHVRPDLEPEVETAPAKLEPPALVAPPCFVLVHGAEIGRVFSLTSAGPWRIGRHRHSDISLDFDPFVSGEHAVVLRSAGEGHVIRDSSANRNGTTVNLQPLARGGSARLAQGDLVGVGRSLLLYRDA